MATHDLDLKTEQALRAIGEKIRACRAEAEITQERLSELTGIDVKRIQRIEGGLANVTIKTLVRIAIALDASLSVVFSER